MRRWLCSVLLCALFVGVVGCTSSQDKTPAKPATPDGGSPPEEIKIGVVLPLTGETAWGGVPSRWAAQMAADEINAAGGINGKKLKLVFADGQCQPQVTASATEQLITLDKVQFVMGEWASSATIAAVEVAKKYQVPFLCQISTADGIAKNGGKYTFMSVLQNSDTVDYLTEIVLNNLKFQSAAIVVENNDFGRTFMTAVDKALVSAGKKVLDKITCDRAATNYVAEVTRLNQMKPDVVVFTMTQAAAANFVRTCKEKGLSSKLLGHYPPPPVIFERAVGNAAIGLERVTFFTESEKNTEKQKQWCAKFKAYFKEKTGNETPVLHWFIVSYDGIYLIADAIRRGGLDKDAWVGAMEKTSHDGVLGHYEFMPDHHVKPDGLPMMLIRDVPGEGNVPKLEVVHTK